MKFLLKNPGFCGGGPINFSKKAPLPTHSIIFDSL
jgi:hypothetical protein